MTKIQSIKSLHLYLDLNQNGAGVFFAKNTPPKKNRLGLCLATI